jgi:hypothetical protein
MQHKLLKNYRGDTCLNCEHPLDISDKYCSNCGQSNSSKRLSLNDFINEFFANFYAYDSRVRKTIKSLFLKPGIAAKEFIDGKRQTFVNPFRLYLSVSILFFIVAGFNGKYNAENKDFIGTNSTNKPFITIHNANDTLKVADIIPIEEYTEHELKKFGFLKTIQLKLDRFTEFHEKHQNLDINESLDSLRFEKTFTNQYLYKKAIDSYAMFSEDGDFTNFYDYFKSNFPVIFFISLPFLTLAFSLVYYKKKLNYAEHMVFVFSLMSFVFLIKFIEMLLIIALDVTADVLVDVGLIFYFYKSLRNFYQQTRLKTIFKFVILTIILIILITIAIIITLGTVFLIY